MRNERVVCVIAAYLSKNLGCHVGIIQGDGYTEWTTGDRGFALINEGKDWTPKQIAVHALKHLYVAPPQKKRKGNEDDS